MSPFLAALLGVFFLAYIALGAIALRRPFIPRIALREAARRPGQTALVVAGLMIAGAAIFSSQVLLDSLNLTEREDALRGWGADDIEVTAGGAYFDAGLAPRLAADPSFTRTIAATQNSLILTGSVVDLDRQAGKPNVQITALDLASQQRFGAFVLRNGRSSYGEELAAGGAFIARPLADEIGARAGDRLRIWAAGRSTDLVVAGVVERLGAGAYGADRSVFVSLPTAQQMAGVAKVNLIRISASGTGDAEIANAKALAPGLSAAVGGLGLQVVEVKRAALEIIEGVNDRTFTTSFGLLVALAATGMVVNLAVMLAEERRPRLAVLRALGLTRSGLVQLAVTEGALYSLLGALAGMAGGLLLALALIASGQVIANDGELTTFHVQWSSLIGSVAAAALINLATVLVTSWRTSRMTIASAIRELPEPARVRGTGRGHQVWLALLTAAGVLACIAGIDHRLVGGAMLIAAAASFLRGRIPDRVRFSAGGAAAAIWAIAYYRYYFADVNRLHPGAFQFFLYAFLVSVAGLSFLAGANLALLETAAALPGWLSSGLRATLRQAVAYASRRPMRSGLVIASVSLVMAMFVVFQAFLILSPAFYEAASGGWDVQVSVVGSDQLAVPPALASEVARAEQVRNRTFFGPVRWSTPTGGWTEWQQQPLTVQGLDDRQLGAEIMPLNLGTGYSSDAAAWSALASDPSLVVTSDIPPGARVELATARGTITLHVIAGTPSSNGNFSSVLPGLIGSLRTLDLLGDTAPGALLLLKAAPGTSPSRLAHDLQQAALPVGADASTTKELLDRDHQYSASVLQYILLLMRLGLLVGVASLGAFALRAVIERRRSIGILRALGFQPPQLLAGMLIEAVLVASAGLAVGVLVAYATGSALVGGASGFLYFNPDPGQIWATVALVYAAVLLATLVPALRVARLRPAEALRTVG